MPHLMPLKAPGKRKFTKSTRKAIEKKIKILIFTVTISQSIIRNNCRISLLVFRSSIDFDII
jgi:hypothetical protein